MLIHPANWMRVVGLVAGTTELVVGVPLAYVTAQQLGRFSLFALGPIACLVLVILLVLPGLWERWTIQKDLVVDRLPAARLGLIAGKP